MRNMNRRKFIRTLALAGVAAVAMNVAQNKHVLAQPERFQYAQAAKDKKKKITPADRKAAAGRTKAARQAAGITNVALVTDTASGKMVPDYFGTTPNYANSPILRKFVDALPGLGAAAANGLGQYIPVAVPDTTTYPGADYYEIELGQYQEQMHSDLPKSTLRGYRQTNGPDTSFHSMGPLIIADRDRPVRVKFTNSLPTGTGGNLFIPCDHTYMGAGMGPKGMNVTPGNEMDYAENRATLHLHGGNTPWISDGTTHQWTTPAGELTDYPKGVSVQNVPDMAPAGPGQLTFYYTNQQSARLMFYHDHAYGITRLNVYAGEAAGYLLRDPVEQGLISSGVLPDNGIPLIIQDKTFVDDVNIATQDPTWLDPKQTFGTGKATDPNTGLKLPVKGDLWFPHVYMSNQNPYDISGANGCGRWDYGPWFWPPFTGLTNGPLPNPYANIPGEPPVIPGTPLPSGVPEGFMDTPVVNGTAYPTLAVQPKAYRFRILNACNDRNINLQLYVATSIVSSLTITAPGSGYVDNPAVIISGDGVGATAQAVVDQVTGSPTFGQVIAINMMTVGSGYTTASVTIAPPPAGGTQATATATIYTTAPNGTLTEVGMVPAVPGSWPSGWPTPDARDGGFPDPANRGPQFIQIGNESGILPSPVLIPNRPVGYDYDRRSITVLNVLEQALFMGPAERADVIVDFSAFAGKTIILYNDAPAPVPAFDPRLDYYTADMDQVDTGGVPSTQPGMGPNTRTIMQIIVSGTAAPAYNLAALQAALPVAYGQSQDKPIAPQAAYNTAFGANYPVDSYVRIQDTSSNVVNGSIALTLTSGGAGYTAAPAVTIGAPSTGGMQATAVANLAPVALAGLTLTAGGSNYTTAPIVAISGGGGSGAAATATLAPRGVASVTITGGGNGYTSLPTVTFSAPPSGTRATGTAVVTNRKVTGVTITNPGSGYTSSPSVSFSGGGGSGATGTAVLRSGPVGGLTLTNPGSGFTSAPTVTFSGGGGMGAAARAAITPTVVASLNLINAGNGYLATPTVTIAPPQTTGTTATATASLGMVNMKIKPKAIQELFTTDYGRMNAILGVEIPNTTGINQTTIPYGYIDPPTEIVTDSTGATQIGAAPDGSQIWKITHNGVDTHTIHFHLFNVQLINRVGWDGMIKPPLPNEIGWKESVRMHPLEDCIVALRPYAQNLPWELPNSIRNMDVTMPAGSTVAFTNVDPTGQPATVVNTPINFGYEYIWHCHLLGHEENDMMRPIIFLVAPKQAPVLALPTVVKGGVALAWTEASPNVTSFTIQRSTGLNSNTWTTLATIGKANNLVFNYTDTTVKKNNTYNYRVIANNQVGYLQTYVAPAAGYPTDMVSTGPSNVMTLTY